MFAKLKARHVQVRVSVLSKTESPGVSNTETYDQRYSQACSECTVRNISGRAMLPDSTVHVSLQYFKLRTYQ